ncbi:MAG: rRNA synthase [Methylobacteriaceae bacterium]|jgi:23S rRNA pseudouridine2605 synthase|nr:rRNA synthase [Methylobacteriaceae bacterium]
MPDRNKRRGEPQKRPHEGARVRPARGKAAHDAAQVSAERVERGERIAKLMARAGLCSRREAETWIAAGRVAVNGRVLTSPALNVTANDTVLVDGKPMEAPERTRLFLFNKPGGLVTTDRDPEGRRTVFAYVAERYPDLPRLISIGRLDINTEGLLLLTNDGGLARVLELPATGWIRRYRVRANGETDETALGQLRRGVTVEGVKYAPAEVTLDRAQGANVWLTLGLREGKNREVKRLLEHIGLQVNRLIRLSFGPFQLGNLEDGAVEEVNTRVLRDQLGPSLASAANASFSRPSLPQMQMELNTNSGLGERKRKHVRALRAKEKKEKETQKTPRRRIVRSATEDRQGREVAVERVVPTRPSRGRPKASRNARRFGAEREAGPGRARPRR